MKHPIKIRRESCVICGVTVEVSSATSPHPEAPEMLKGAGGVWLGLAAAHDGPVEASELIVCCSDACADRLLAEDA